MQTKPVNGRHTIRFGMEYQPDTGLSDHHAAGALWLARRGISVDPSQTIVTAGAQHGIIVSLAALTRPGDRILT